MPLTIVRNDITKMECDAIVNAANNSLLGGGGVDGAIHRAAGPELLEECRRLGGCDTGKAKITGGYRLPAKYIIHTAGPVWQDGKHGERELLCSCYRESLALAAEKKCNTIAFPLISAGVYGYPKAEALRVAADTCMEFLKDHEMMIYIVIFDKAALAAGEKLFADVRKYIDDNYAEEHSDRKNFEAFRRKNALFGMVREDAAMSMEAEEEEAEFIVPSGLARAIEQIDESFSQMLLRMIDEKGMTDVECYKKANIDRKLFSKIRGDIHYRPKKTTVIAFAAALELTIDETRDMLMKAGFALSHSSKFDIIVEYFIKKGRYDIFEMNEMLFSFDQPLIGG